MVEKSDPLSASELESTIRRCRNTSVFSQVRQHDSPGRAPQREAGYGAGQGRLTRHRSARVPSFHKLAPALIRTASSSRDTGVSNTGVMIANQWPRRRTCAPHHGFAASSCAFARCCSNHFWYSVAARACLLIPFFQTENFLASRVPEGDKARAKHGPNPALCGFAQCISLFFQQLQLAPILFQFQQLFL